MRGPHGSDAVRMLLSGKWDGTTDESSALFKVAQGNMYSPMKEPKRSVPRPEDSVQMIRCLRDGKMAAPHSATTTLGQSSFNLIATAKLSPSFLNDHQLSLQRRKYPLTLLQFLKKYFTCRNNIKQTVGGIV